MSTPQRQLLACVKTLTRLANETVDPNHVAALRSHAIGLELLADAVTPKLSPSALTPAQSRVLTYLQRYHARNGYAPTRKEMCVTLGFSSPNAAQDHLKALERKGWLTRTGGEPRAIRLHQISRTLLTTNKEPPCHSVE
jgi:DNA-binding MarR family transcriptional regulator